MKLALLVANRGFFPSSVIESAYDEMRQAAQKVGVELLEIEKDKVCVMGKDIARSEMRWVKAIVYVGRVGNALDNRKFLEECAAGKPTLEMLGSMEVCYTGKDGKPVCEYAVCENIVEALMAILEHGKIEYRLGYSLGKDYLVSTYNVNDYMAELKSEKTDVKEKSKFKQLI